MSFFNPDFAFQARQQLATALRKVVHTAWVRLLVSPVIYLNTLFATWRAGNIYTLSHNGQVCKLTGALNDTFDAEGRSIYITDDYSGEPWWFFLPAEHRAATYLRTAGEYATGSYGPWEYLFTSAERPYSGAFIVNVDGVLTPDYTRMNAIIRRYKLPGTNYSIRIY
jgi:hypothetical protein